MPNRVPPHGSRLLSAFALSTNYSSFLMTRVLTLLIGILTLTTVPGLAQPSQENASALETASCMGATDIEPSTSVKVLMGSLMKCTHTEQNYEHAAELILVAYAFQGYDQQRVQDASAHGALSVVMQQILQNLSQSSGKKLMAEVRALKGNTEHRAPVCSHLRKMGPPTHRPTYMRQHGMGAVMDSMNGESSERTQPGGFDPERAWATAIAKVGCSEGEAED